MERDRHEYSFGNVYNFLFWVTFIVFCFVLKKKTDNILSLNMSNELEAGIGHKGLPECVCNHKVLLAEEEGQERIETLFRKQVKTHYFGLPLFHMLKLLPFLARQVL